MSNDGGSIRHGRGIRGQKQPTGYGDAVLSDEEVLRRVDLREAPRPQLTAAEAAAAEAAAAESLEMGGWIGGTRDAPLPIASAVAPAAASPAAWTPALSPDPTVETRRVERLRPIPAAADDRRRQLWRDSATILIAVVLLLLAGQVFIPQQTAGPVGSPTPLPSAVAIGSVAPPVSLPPDATFGPIINPSLGVDATPTPIPVITMGPTPSPSPSVAPTDSAHPSVRPSVKPSIKPSPKPTAKSSQTPTPPPAAPIAGFNRSASEINVGDSVDFTDTSTGSIDTWSWDFGDGDTSSAMNPSHTYLSPCDCTVRLTVTGPGGSDFIEHPVTVSVLPSLIQPAKVAAW